MSKHKTANRQAIIKDTLFYPSVDSSSKLTLLFAWKESEDGDEVDDIVAITGSKEQICVKTGLDYNEGDCDFEQLKEKGCTVRKGLKNQFIGMSEQVLSRNLI